MNVYDFDKTIYPIDSSVAFFKYVLLRHPWIGRRLPKMAITYLKFRLGLISKTALKEVNFAFLQDLKHHDQIVVDFWSSRKLSDWYLKQKEDEDVIISASPDFLLRPFLVANDINRLIASKVEPKSGKFLSPNCYGEEKVKRFIASPFSGEIDKFYSDSESDLPLARLAKEAYLVKGNKRQKWVL